MAVVQEPKRALLTFVMSVAACSTYGPALVVDSGGSGGTEGGAAALGGAGGVSAAASGSAAGGVSAGGGQDSTAGTAAGVAAAGEPSVMPVEPFVTVILADPSISVGLSLQGPLDWAHWGLQNVGDYNHKAGVESQLLDFKPTGAAGPVRYRGGPVTMSWSDGTPTPSASTNDGIAWQGVDNGFEVVVPAVVEARRMRLYLGIFGAAGRVVAQLSDMSGHSSADNQFTSDTAAWVLQVATVDYGSCEKPDTTLTVRWKVDTAMTAGAAVSLTGLAIARM